MLRAIPIPADNDRRLASCDVLKHTLGQEAQFLWQHGVSWTPAGTLLMSTDIEPPGGSRSTAVREYRLSEEDGTLSEVWTFDPGVLAGTNGDAWRLDNGNTLHTVGSAGQLYEVTADGDVVWRVDFGGRYLLGRSELVSDLYALVSPGAR